MDRPIDRYPHEDDTVDHMNAHVHPDGSIRYHGHSELNEDDDAEDVAAQLDGEPSLRDLVLRLLKEVEELRQMMAGRYDVYRGGYGGGSGMPSTPIAPVPQWTDNTWHSEFSSGTNIPAPPRKKRRRRKAA